MTLKEIYDEAVEQGKENYKVIHWMDNSEGPYDIIDYDFDDEREEICLY